MVVLAAAASFLLLLAVGRRRGAPTGLALATSIALGIGLHNLGEGLAIGAAFATGAAGLGTFLVLGFTLHNVTEGIGIAAPLVKEPPAALRLRLAGAARRGARRSWASGSAASPTARTGRRWRSPSAPAPSSRYRRGRGLLVRSDARWRTSSIPVSVIGGLLAGLALMYATAVFVKV